MTATKERGDIEVIWLQDGIYNEEARQLAEQAGITVIQDRCMMKEFKRLLPQGTIADELNAKRFRYKYNIYREVSVWLLKSKTTSPGLAKIDWELRKFHGEELSTHRGSSYNSYLVRDEKTVLIDTVWGPFDREFVSKLKQVIDLKKIDYIVANHGETDHSGSLPELHARDSRHARLLHGKRR